MLYSEQIKKAALLAYKAHHEQKDKNGYPYILHPLHLAESMVDETAAIVALLHDTVEDTNLTLQDIKKDGFSDAVIEALGLLTHDSKVPYMEYVKTISRNETARTVKLTDLKHNSDLSRLTEVTEKDRERVKKYEQAIRLLSSM